MGDRFYRALGTNSSPIYPAATHTHGIELRTYDISCPTDFMLEWKRALIFDGEERIIYRKKTSYLRQPVGLHPGCQDNMEDENAQKDGSKQTEVAEEHKGADVAQRSRFEHAS